VAVTQWDAEAKEWNLVSDFMQSDQDVIQPLIDADSSAYAEENAIEGNC
jgi:branched-chain amino acid transport system substrate-binding protein